MTAMAMENALKLFKEKQRKDKDTAKVTISAPFYKIFIYRYFKKL